VKGFEEGPGESGGEERQAGTRFDLGADAGDGLAGAGEQHSAPEFPGQGGEEFAQSGTVFLADEGEGQMRGLIPESVPNLLTDSRHRGGDVGVQRQTGGVGHDARSPREAGSGLAHQPDRID